MEDSKDAPPTVAKAVPTKNILESDPISKDLNPISNTPQGFPNFQIGHEVAAQESSLFQDGDISPGTQTNPEEALDSILDIDIPEIPAVDEPNKHNTPLFEKQESNTKEKSGKA